jgi:XTP/dITP diphosphohydrolase
MDKLIIATNNPGKVREIKDILAGRFDKIVSLKDEGLIIDVMEDGVTFEENAVKKAREVARLTDSWALADDSGLCVDYLDGAPGVYSARFAGEKATDAMNNEKLLRLMKDSPEAGRGAHYACCMALSSPGGETVTAYGEVYGEIVFTPRGTNGFGYDPIFYMKEYGKTMAELAPEIKNGISHRYRALKALEERLQVKKP